MCFGEGSISRSRRLQSLNTAPSVHWLPLQELPAEAEAEQSILLAMNYRLTVLVSGYERLATRCRRDTTNEE